MAKFTKEELDAFDKAKADISALPSVYSKLKNHSDSRILAWHINGQRSKGHKQTDEHKQKNREAKIGRKQTDEHKQKNREAKIGRKHTDEVKQKIGAISRGRKQTDEQKQKNREAQLGRKHTDESKQNISKTLVCVSLSAAVCVFIYRLRIYLKKIIDTKL